jgi:hypothetical protein
MRPWIFFLGLAIFLSACSTSIPPQSKYQAECRTHARKATYSGEADQQGFYLECLKIKGAHDIVVTETP